MLNVRKPLPLIAKGEASYVFWPETEYRCSDQCTQLKSPTECAKFGPLIQIDAPAGSCDYYEHGGQTDWKMPVTGCLTKDSAGYGENPSRQGFGCKRCQFFDADSLDCYRGIDKDSDGPTPGIIHPNACCDFQRPDEVRGKMTRDELVTYFEGQKFSEAARLTQGVSDMDPRATTLLKEADAALALSHSDICKSLSDALDDMFPGQYCYVRDVFGDDESGDVVYCCGGDTFKASYEIGLANGNRTTSIDTDNQVNVLPRTVYDEEADEDDHMASMADDTDVDEALAMENIFERFPGSKAWNVPIRERFISKAERDAADSSDFAGKGKSYPILKPGDVMAAVRAMGRAGSDNKSTNALKAAIIRIAKRKGWTKYLPKAWQGDDAKESKRDAMIGETVKLYESAATLETIVLKEAKSDYGIKLIAPGKGSSAFYPKEVLERDGPKVFKAGTHVYLNHPTAAEEASRPEGDVKNLAGVLTTTAVYNESGASGPGLYARMKVFADHAQTVEEKAPHVGMSIRASGIAESGKSKDGLPVLKELVSAESVDVVTRAGAGGLILQEGARPASANSATTTQENSMAETLTAEQATKLIEAGIAKANAPLLERLRKADATDEARKILEGVTLPPAAKTRIIERVVSNVPLKEGEIDIAKLREAVVAEAKSEGEYLASITGSGRVIGMGPTIVTEADEKAARKAEKKKLKEAKRLKETGRDAFEGLGLPKEAAKLAAREVA